MTTPYRLGFPRIPAPEGVYNRENEAQFRQNIESLLRQLTQATNDTVNGSNSFTSTLNFIPDNTIDVGDIATPYRPRTVYAATSVSAPTLVGTTRVTSPKFGTTGAVDVILDRGGVTQVTLSSLLATFAGAIAVTTSATAATVVGTTRVTSPLLGTTTAANVVFDRNSVTQLTLGSLAATFAGTAAMTQALTPIVDSNAVTDLLLKRNAVTQLTLASLAATFAGDLTVSGDNLNVNGLTYTWPASQAANRVLRNTGPGTLAWSQVDLSTDVTGALATGTVPLSQVTAGTSPAGTFIFPTLAGTVRVTSPLIGTTTATNVVFDRNSVTQLTLGSLLATFAGDVTMNGTALKFPSGVTITGTSGNSLFTGGSGAATNIFGSAIGFLTIGGALRWQINTANGDLVAGADNAVDIGASGATRPRTGYFATSVDAPTLIGSTRVTSPLIGTTSAVDVVFDRNSVTQLTLGSLAATFAGTVQGTTLTGTTRVTSPLMGTTTNTNVVFDRNSVTQLSLFSLAATFAGSLTVTTGLNAASTVRVGTTSAPSVDVGLWMSTSVATAVTAYGTRSDATFPATTTTTGYAGYFRLQTAASAFTMVNGYGLYIEAPSIGAASAVTNGYGLRIVAATWAGTTGYGIDIGNVTGATTNRAIRTGTGLVQFGDDLIFTNDNTDDIGATGATRPRTGYFGTSLIAPFLDSGAAADLLLKRNAVTQLTLGSLTATFAGVLSAKRYFGTGTAHVAGDYVANASWGTTRSVSAVAATDTGGRVTITCNGASIVANPTVTLTFKDGTWTTIPAIVITRGDGTAPTTGFWALTTASATAPVFTFFGTPVAGSTYTFDFVVMGK